MRGCKRHDWTFCEGLGWRMTRRREWMVVKEKMTRFSCGAELKRREWTGGWKRSLHKWFFFFFFLHFLKDPKEVGEKRNRRRRARKGWLFIMFLLANEPQKEDSAVWLRRDAKWLHFFSQLGGVRKRWQEGWGEEGKDLTESAKVEGQREEPRWNEMMRISAPLK